MTRGGSLLALSAVLLGCQSAPPPAVPSAPDATAEDAAPPVVCCPPSPYPECCMQLGGAQIDGECPVLTCDIPDGATPGWSQVTDSNGCATWVVPPGPGACGGALASPPFDAGPPCTPVSTSAYAPSPLVPPNPATASCTQQELAEFYAACIALGAESGSCMAFGPAHPTCVTCLVSQATAPSWGPVVFENAIATLDVPGCVALVQHDSSPTSCAQRISSELGCESFACAAVCPVDVDGGANAYEQCAQEAAAGECYPYLAAECELGDGGAPCVDASGAAGFVRFASVFCGGM